MDYMQDSEISKFYKEWRHGATSFDHILDRERFYRFVKSCVRHVGKGDLRRELDIDILKAYLYDDLAELRQNNYPAYEKEVHKIIVLFETLLEYEDTNLL